MKKLVIAVLVMVLAAAAIVYAGSRPKQIETPIAVNEPAPAVVNVPATQVKDKKYKVTFVELGSVKCIPCKAMVPVMKEIEEKYGNDVKVVFHDVWTPAGQPYATQYGIRGIPTQVFLDINGKEFHRHTGFYPLEQILPLLKGQGVKVD